MLRLFNENMDFLLLLIFNEWNISAMERVKKAMVIPSGLSAISHRPDSMRCPIKYAAKVSKATIIPCQITSVPKPLANIPSLESRGGCFIASSSPSSIPRAIAGKESVIKFIHSKCTGFNIVNPNKVATKIAITSDRFEASRN